MDELTPTRITGGDVRESCPAERAIDKDLLTPAVVETNNGAGWLKFEFGKIYRIHEVIIFHRFYTNWYNSAQVCAQSEESFRACIDSQSNMDVSVYKGDVKQKSCGTLELTYGLDQSDQIYTLVCDVEGDAVKLSKDSGQMYVFEMVVIKKCK